MAQQNQSNGNQTGKHRSNVLTVMSKELRRFFGDRRMVVTLFLPGVLLYVLYTLLGNVMMSNLLGGGEPEAYTVYAENLPASVCTVAEEAQMPIRWVDADAPRDAVAAQTLDLYMVFPADFDETVAAYTPASGMPAPEVKLYYNSASTSSDTAFRTMTGLLNGYESAMTNKFDINRGTEPFDLASAEDMTGMLLSMLMPMLLLAMLFTGCLAVAPESIAGEKERGTLATLLVTPLRRSELAVGKIAALSVIALISGLCSFCGIMLSLPSLMGAEITGMDTGIYGVPEYVSLLLVILSTTLVFVSLISVLSAMASSVKEASGMVSPLMAVIMLLSLTTSVLPKLPGIGAFCIPVYNSVRCIEGVFSMDYTPVGIGLTVLVNLALTAVLVFVLTRLFNSEKVMFKK